MSLLFAAVQEVVNAPSVPVEVKTETGWLTAALTAVTPLVLLFSLWVQRIWASRTIKLAENAADAAVAVKQKLSEYDKEMRVSLAILQQTTTSTHLLVNSEHSMILRNMALLARNHASMARAVATKTNAADDMGVAQAAELAAMAAEADYIHHEENQNIIKNTPYEHPGLLANDPIVKPNTREEHPPTSSAPATKSSSSNEVENLGTIEVVRNKD